MRFAPMALVAFLVITWAPCCLSAHNAVSLMLSGRRDLAEFKRGLMATGLADDINGLSKVTLLAVDNAQMAQLKERSLSRQALRRVLSLHVLLDYYDDARLHQLSRGSTTFVSSMLRRVAGGNASGSAGMLKISSEGRSGRVAFEPQDMSAAHAKVWYLKPVHESPQHMSALQVSGLISCPAAGAPAASPDPDPRLELWDVMLSNGCGRFAELVTATADAAAAYNKSAHGGLTVFCPADKAMEAFEPSLKKRDAGTRLKLLLYHGVRAHYSIRALKVNNGAMNTLATDENVTYNIVVDIEGDNVTLVSAARRAAIVVRTLMDENHLVVHMIDSVLLSNDFAELGPADANAPWGGDGDGHLNSSGATGKPLLAALASTAGVMAASVLLVSASMF